MMAEYDNLEADPELDARVAGILGWEVRRIDGPFDYEGKRQASEVWASLPNFSTSHEAAALIKEFLRDQDISIQINWWTENKEPSAPAYVAVDMAGGITEYLEVAGTEPLALCRFLVRLDDEGVINDE